MKANLKLILLLITICGKFFSQDITIDVESLMKKTGDTAEKHSVKIDASFKVIFKKNVAGKKINLQKSEDDIVTVFPATTTADITFTFVVKERKLTLAYKNKTGEDKTITIEKNFSLIYGDKNIVFLAGASNSGAPAKTDKETETKKTYYWIYTESPANGTSKTVPKFDLSDFMFKTEDECCDNCEACDECDFEENNRIIYDAKTGLTYYLPAGESPSDNLCTLEDQTGGFITYKVGNKWRKKKKIRRSMSINAGEPLVYIVQNVNPYDFDIKLSDTAFYTNNVSNEVLETLLLSKSETTAGFSTPIQGGTELSAEEKQAEKDYLIVKSAMIVVRSELIKLFNNFRSYSPYMNKCITAKKAAATASINAYVKTIDNNKYKDLDLPQLVDIFLSQLPEDTLLNKQVKLLYTDLNTPHYEIAYRYPQVPKCDIFNFNLSIVANKASPFPSLLRPGKQSPTQTVYVKNFFKVDVSSGLYLGWKRDQVYSLGTDSTKIANKKNNQVDSTVFIKRIIDESPPDKIEFGFASFLHFYYKFCPGFNVSATLGAGFSFSETVRVRYFTGASFLLGRQNRLCINGGIAWGNYKELSNQYQKDGNNKFKALKSSETELKYITRFTFTPFVSLSYNLPFLDRKSKKTAAPGN